VSFTNCDKGFTKHPQPPPPPPPPPRCTTAQKSFGRKPLTKLGEEEGKERARELILFLSYACSLPDLNKKKERGSC